jgi:hypothetical protein
MNGRSFRARTKEFQSRIQFDGNFKVCWRYTFSSQTREYQKSEESSAKKSVVFGCVTFVGLRNFKHNCTSDFEEGFVLLSL